jgi:hypothetical protein
MQTATAMLTGGIMISKIKFLLVQQEEKREAVL